MRGHYIYMYVGKHDMYMLSDLQLVYMMPRNSTQLLNIYTTKFQVERETILNLVICKDRHHNIHYDHNAVY